MSYLPHTADDRSHMLSAVGVASMEELLTAIPSELRLKRPLDLPEALSEYDLVNCLEELAAKNAHFSQGSFLGAGAYRHFIPSIVDAVISRSEFLTAYTPYQAEASQGTLQTIFEFQSMISRLTGMDLANASVYDGGTAATDACLMALAKTRRRKLLVSRAVHPHTREVLATYLAPAVAAGKVVIEELPLENGLTQLTACDKDTAAVLVQVPNFLGSIEDGPALCAKAHESGALAIVIANDPVSLAMLEAPGHYGADICCGDAQAFGNPLGFGGPYVGFLACNNALLRSIPGRLVGLTEDHEGRRGFCLTLQAREQHIRREKASSNICSNQALCALAATVYLSLLGPVGLTKAADASLRAAELLKKNLREDGWVMPITAPTFNEFVLQVPAGRAEALNAYLAERGIQGGFLLGEHYPEYHDCVLLCCTELTKAAEIAALVAALKQFKEAR